MCQIIILWITIMEVILKLHEDYKSSIIKEKDQPVFIFPAS
jgi:hypothetical protein